MRPCHPSPRFRPRRLPPPRPAPPAPPAQQVAPVAVALALGAESGAAQLRIALDPEELGRVEISVERAGPGEAASVRILAERPETLALLQRDARELDRALTQAGLGADTAGGGGGCTLSFALADGGGSGRDGGQQRGASAFRQPQGTTSAPPTPDDREGPPRPLLSLPDIAV